MEECRFVTTDGSMWCVAHPVGSPATTRPALCAHAAAELGSWCKANETTMMRYQAQINELERAAATRENLLEDYRRQQVILEDRIRELEQQVEELLGLAGMDKQRIARLEEDKAQAEQLVKLWARAFNAQSTDNPGDVACKFGVRLAQAEAREGALRGALLEINEHCVPYLPNFILASITKALSPNAGRALADEVKQNDDMS